MQRLDFRRVLAVRVVLILVASMSASACGYRLEAADALPEVMA
jgi:hypothetical protein